MAVCVCGHDRDEHSQHGPKPCISIVMWRNEKPQVCKCTRFSAQAETKAAQA